MVILSLMEDKKEQPESFGSWLRRQLVLKGFSQVDFAARIGVKPPQVSRIISGDRGTTLQLLDTIADVLNTPREIIYSIASQQAKKQNRRNYVIEQINMEAGDLPEVDQLDILEYTRLRRRIAEERGKYETHKSDKSRTRKP